MTKEDDTGSLAGVAPPLGLGPTPIAWRMYGTMSDRPGGTRLFPIKSCSRHTL